MGQIQKKLNIIRLNFKLNFYRFWKNGKFFFDLSSDGLSVETAEYAVVPAVR